MSALWTSDEVAAATGGTATAAFAASGVSVDSRTIAPGDLFVALAGPNFDGHDYVGDAAAKGAAAALVARPCASRLPQVTAGDTHEALVGLGRAARARAAARVVAITGSVGKTGTKAMCARALATAGRVHASAASYNNHVGLPLTLARLDQGFDFAVVELGMNRAGEISALTATARPHVAVITTVAPAHLEFFADVSAVAAAKAEIFLGVAEGGAAVLNRDNACFPLLARAARESGIARIVAFGAGAESDVRLLDCAAGPHGSRVRAAVAGAEIVYAVPLAGRHWAHDSLAVLAVAHALGADVAAAAAALEGVCALPGRGRRFSIALDGGPVDVIDDAYNASPASMTAAFETLALAPAGGRRIAVLGDMLELGADGEAMHAALARDAERTGIDLVFTAGPLMAALHAALPAARRGAHVDDAAALTPLLRGALRPHDAVLIKGSHGAAMHEVVAALEALAPAAGADLSERPPAAAEARRAL